MATINWKDAVGRAVRRERSGLRLSQEELGEMSDLSRTYVSLIESADASVSLEAFVRIALALGKRPWELLREAEDLVPPKKSR